MHLALPPLHASARLTLGAEDRLDAESFYELCAANPEIRMELTAEGEVIVMPPAGDESDFRSLEVAGELRSFAKRDGRGIAFGSTAGFQLPSGAVRSPDASWVSHRRVKSVSYSQRRRFMPVVPEFVVEVVSPSDNLTEAQAKMQEWMAAGVEVGWLIDGDARTVFLYRQGQEPQAVSGASELVGEGPVEGFVLPLEPLWTGLEYTAD